MRLCERRTDLWAGGFYDDLIGCTLVMGIGQQGHMDALLAGTDHQFFFSFQNHI